MQEEPNGRDEIAPRGQTTQPKAVQAATATDCLSLLLLVCACGAWQRSPQCVQRNIKHSVASSGRVLRPVQATLSFFFVSFHISHIVLHPTSQPASIPSRFSLHLTPTAHNRPFLFSLFSAVCCQPGATAVPLSHSFSLSLSLAHTRRPFLFLSGTPLPQSRRAWKLWTRATSDSSGARVSGRQLRFDLSTAFACRA